MATSRLEYLFDRYVNKTANEAEENEFLELAEKPENKEQLQNLLQDLINETDSSEGLLPESEEAILEAIFKVQPPAKLVPMRTGFRWKRIAVAASVILTIGISSYFIFFNHNGTVQPITDERHSTNDVPAPDVTKATLKLDNGTIVYLDSANNGSLAMQGNVNVIKTADGQITYKSTVNSSQTTARYNTISNPRGSKIQTIILGDGTRILLNTESSLTYPTAFVGKERKVSITGEAYFEVARDASKKFMVDANGITTEVLGTHFNVNSYSDEEKTKVTLLEGSVKVSRQSGVSSHESVIIKPGQQAIAMSKLKSDSDRIQISSNTDIEEVMGWKNGYFHFESGDLKAMLREFARWYNVEVSYEGQISDRKFFCIVKRTSSLATVLNTLKANQVNYRIEGKNVVITQ